MKGRIAAFLVTFFGTLLVSALSAPDGETIRTVANVEKGAYPFTREAYLVTTATPPTEVTAFLEFVRSAKGAAVLKANDAIPAR